MKRAALTLWNYRTHQAAKVEPYLDALRYCGFEPVLFSADEPWSLAGIAAVMLAGGSDIDPACYGEPRDPMTQAPDHPRDAMELDVLRSALELKLPVLGICRGMQLMNVAFGGGLHQDIPGHKEGFHDVAVRGRLAAIYGQAVVRTNSRHHQAASRIGAGLIVSGTAGDGTIEAVERPGDGFVIGVQWHPEDMLEDMVQLKLFQAFGEAE